MSSHHTSGAHFSPEDQQSAHDEGFSTTMRDNDSDTTATLESDTMWDSESNETATLRDQESGTEDFDYDMIRVRSEADDVLSMRDDETVGTMSEVEFAGSPTVEEVTRYLLAATKFWEGDKRRGICFDILQIPPSLPAQTFLVPPYLFSRLAGEGTFDTIAQTGRSELPVFRMEGKKIFQMEKLTPEEMSRWQQSQAQKTNQIFQPLQQVLRSLQVTVEGVERLPEGGPLSKLGRFNVEQCADLSTPEMLQDQGPYISIHTPLPKYQWLAEMGVETRGQTGLAS